MARRIGLLGGSFNPAHRGHRATSLAAMEALGLDEIWWLVSPGNPLKPKHGMAPYPARLRSALHIARRSRIKVSDFEAEVGTIYTVDTVAALLGHWPRHDFIWLMGADTVVQFHQWKDWRRLAGMVPIAVLPRPGYDGAARAARAMGWLRRFVRSPAMARSWTEWSVPAITFLRLPPDPTTATRRRMLDPCWYRRSPSAAAFTSPTLS